MLCTAHLQGEVDVTGCVNNVDAVSIPLACCCSGCDCDAALLLLHHPVHGGCALVHLTNLVGLAGVIQDALRGGGLMCETRQGNGVCGREQRGGGWEDAMLCHAMP